MPHRPVACPSARCEEDAELFGVVQSDGLIAYLGKPIKIDGLWALQFGHGATASSANGTTNTLFFTAGPSHEDHGLFGSLVNVPPPGRQ